MSLTFPRYSYRYTYYTTSALHIHRLTYDRCICNVHTSSVHPFSHWYVDIDQTSLNDIITVPQYATGTGIGQELPVPTAFGLVLSMVLPSSFQFGLGHSLVRLPLGWDGNLHVISRAGSFRNSNLHHHTCRGSNLCRRRSREHGWYENGSLQGLACRARRACRVKDNRSSRVPADPPKC